MRSFSHSKLSTFKRCPLSFYLQYLTKLKPDRPDNVEAFMGSRVHETLELLYRDLLKTKMNSLEELLEFYDNQWRVMWSDDVVINHEEYTQEHYYNLGKKCIENYYQKYEPFDQDQTLGIEKKLSMTWGDYEITGFIDRLAKESDGVYAIHDYKTGALMDQKYADEDRQLALYSIWVRENFPKASQVKLIWHYVAFDEDVRSERSQEQLEALKTSILEVIAEIEKAQAEDNFPAIENMCEWCGYWQYCPKKKHLFKVESLPENEYLKEDGVVLANKYIELSQRKSEINKQANTEKELLNEEMGKIEKAMLKYSEKNGVEVLAGGEKLVNINQYAVYSFPTKSNDKERYQELEDLLKDTKYWPEISAVNSTKLNQLMEDDGIDEKLKNKILELAPLEDKVSFSIKKK